jgi:hypothetical protein
MKNTLHSMHDISVHKKQFMHVIQSCEGLRFPNGAEMCELPATVPASQIGEFSNLGRGKVT